MPIRLFGIRHHGPGSARSLRNALEEMNPDCVLVEGPPDGEAVLSLLAHAEMKPPVALLVYAPEEPSRSVYYPFAAYSPEWQAIEYSLGKGIPVRFMDLPQTHRFAISLAAQKEAENQASEQSGESSGDASPKTEDAPAEPLDDSGATEIEPEIPEEVLDITKFRRDPLNWIAEVAGHSDGETWWEEMVEHRNGAEDLFQGVHEMMATLREASPPETDPMEALREAWMRQTIRAAQREGFEKIAVVCGAWHTPALDVSGPAKRDADLLKNLPKMKVTATWVPWTYGRLTFASGYGAGVQSPAWYERLWNRPEQVAIRWMTDVATEFRKEDLPASTASVIEAVRLAETLASMRDRAITGLPELWEAARSVFCFGSDLPMQLIQERLIVGEKLGRVPDDTPMLPIQQDLRKIQKSLKLPPDASYVDKDLDLRNENDLKRSVLLHRLNLLSVPWGTLQRAGGGKGTFHEIWRLQWHPEFEVKLIEANIFGNTVQDATTSKVREVAEKTESLPELTGMLEGTLFADLPGAMPTLMTRLESLTAVTSDVPHLMDALPPLVSVLRYGSVRQMDTKMISHVVDGLVTRLCIGLPGACSSLNDDAAEEMFPRIVSVHASIRLLQKAEHLEDWNLALEKLANIEGLHGLIAGRACRLLLDQGVWESDEVARRLNLALSAANQPTQAAGWVEGLLKDSGETLVHTDSLWKILDGWVASLTPDLFIQLLPLLRRTFSTMSAPLRRQLGERAKQIPGRIATASSAESNLNAERAEKVLPLVAQLLGLAYERAMQ